MAEWFEVSEISWLRSLVEESLVEDKLLPPSKVKNETATAFWMRMERAGLLQEALELYDQFAEERTEWMHTPRETKKMFAERIEREGRQAEVERVRNELSELGDSLRLIHHKLVYRFQPLDGSRTRPWTTPNPWENGRLFRKKEDQNRLAAEIEGYDKYDNCPKNRWRYEWEQMHQEKGLASSNAKRRVDCAKWRREERVALANARRRAPEAAREQKERQASAKAEAERQAAAKVEAERKAAEEKKQQEIREQEEAEKRKKEERNAHRREQRRLRRNQELANGQQKQLAVTSEDTGDWEQI